MKGARSSAIIYSIVETAKENELNPFHYLMYVLEQLSWIDVSNPAAIKNLLPWSPTLPDHCRAFWVLSVEGNISTNCNLSQ